MKNLTSIKEHSNYLAKDDELHLHEKWKLHRLRVLFGEFLLEPWMFVPCDKDWNVLDDIDFDGYNQIEIEEYKQAKEKCLFEGFECLRGGMSINSNTFYITKDGFDVATKIDELDFDWQFEFKTIEKLSKYKLELTSSAKKQLGF